jgi:hypothetical protein
LLCNVTDSIRQGEKLCKPSGAALGRKVKLDNPVRSGEADLS